MSANTSRPSTANINWKTNCRPSTARSVISRPVTAGLLTHLIPHQFEHQPDEMKSNLLLKDSFLPQYNTQNAELNKITYLDKDMSKKGKCIVEN